MDIFIQLTLNSLVAASLYTLIALGFNLIYGTTRFFDFGYGALITIGGYCIYWLLNTLGLPLFVSALLATLVTGLIGMVLYMFIYKRLRTHHASNMVFLVATLGVFTVLQAVIAILFTSQFRNLSVGNVSTVEIFGGIITHTQIAMILFAIIITILIALLLKHTSLGKQIRAIGDNEEVAKIVGIDTHKVITGVFFLGGAIAGLSGILTGFDTGIEPTMGLSLLFKGVVAAIIGGRGGILGGVFGALLLGFAENYGVWYISGEWKDAITFVILILFLYFRSKGVLR